MKHLRRYTKLLLAILFATCVISCQSNIKNTPTFIKKYSEYTDLDKKNLKREVIGVANYNIFDLLV